MALEGDQEGSTRVRHPAVRREPCPASRANSRCPVYRQFDHGDGFVRYGGADAYTLWISRAPNVDANGRLAGQVGDDGRLEAERDRCVGGLQPGLVASAQDRPGTYYWQVARLCVACPGG